MAQCTFIQITDHHLPADESVLTEGYSSTRALRSVLRHVAANAPHRVDFLVSTGDVVDVPSAPSYQLARRLLQVRTTSEQHVGHQTLSLGDRQDVPMYFLPGNHDDRDQFYRWLVPHTTPRPLFHFTFEHGGVQFIGLDWGPGGAAHGGPEMFHFLERALARGTPSVLFTHHHLVPVDIAWVDALIAENVGELWARLRGKPVLGIFSGHAHCTYEAQVEGIPIFGLRSTAPQFARQDTPRLCFEPPHYRVVNIRDGQLTTRVVEVAG